MKIGKLSAAMLLLPFAVAICAASIAAQGKQGFKLEVQGDWPVKELQGEGAWAYDMAGFFHIGLDAKTDRQWVILDINKKGVERPRAGKHKIGSSNLSGYMATLEIQGDDKSTIRSASGELEISKVGPDGIEGQFHFKSSTMFGSPEVSVSGEFVAKERPKKREK